MYTPFITNQVKKELRKIIVTAEILKEGNMFTAYCPELDVASCGHSPDEAKKNLSDVIGIQLEETSKLGTLKDFLSDRKVSRVDRTDVLTHLTPHYPS
jgi:predicted RNase H-like HicB family nuclease